MGWSCECVLCVCVACVAAAVYALRQRRPFVFHIRKKEVGRTAAVAAGVRVLSISLDDDHPTVYLYFLFGCVFLYSCVYMHIYMSVYFRIVYNVWYTQGRWKVEVGSDRKVQVGRFVGRLVVVVGCRQSIDACTYAIYAQQT